MAPRGGGIPRQRRASALTSFYPKEPSCCGSFVRDRVFIEHLLCARHRRHGHDGRDQSPLRPMGFAGRRTAAGRTGVYSLPRAWAAGPSSEPEPQPRVRRRLGRGSNGRNGEQGIPVGSRGRAGRVAGSSVRGAAGRDAHRRTSAPTELAAGSAHRSPALAPDRPSAHGRRGSPPHTRHTCARERRRPQKHQRARHPSEPHRALVDLHGAPSQGCRGAPGQVYPLTKRGPFGKRRDRGRVRGRHACSHGSDPARRPRTPTLRGRRPPRLGVCLFHCALCAIFFPPESLAVEETLSQLCAELQVIGELRPGA